MHSESLAPPVKPVESNVSAANMHLSKMNTTVDTVERILNFSLAKWMTVPELKPLISKPQIFQDNVDMETEASEKVRKKPSFFKRTIKTLTRGGDSTRSVSDSVIFMMR